MFSARHVQLAMTIAAYVRVSSKAQDHASQVDAITRRATPTVWYAEKASAKTTDRAELKRLLADVRAGLVREVWVFKLDRLARTGVADTFAIVSELRRAGVTLHAVADNLTIRPGADDIVSETLVFALFFSKYTPVKYSVERALAAGYTRAEIDAFMSKAAARAAVVHKFERAKRRTRSDDSMKAWC
jgi:hypothetical protein